MKPFITYYSKVQFLIFFFTFSAIYSNAQSTTGCLAHSFGVDAGLYSNIMEFGTGGPAAGSEDWFYSAGLGGSGIGIIDESNPSSIQILLQTDPNPIYMRHMNQPLSSIANGHILIDAIWGRDHFGGTGGIDQTSYNTASKNGEDPAIWDPGPQNVLGKNDLIDVGGFMFRSGSTLDDHLYFTGFINRAEPGGDAYMDFEFFVETVTYTSGTGFSSGGPQLGHTAFTFDSSGNITRVGDLIFNVSLTGGGTTTGIEVRLWVSYADYSANLHPPGFTWGPDYDGAFTGSPYGYASIIPINSQVCGIVNAAGQIPAAPPWGTKGTKYNSWGTSYAEYSVAEVGIDLTALGIDHSTLLGIDKCIFPIHTFIIKTRASNSFTSQLKDFSGPYVWGQPSNKIIITGNPTLSCENPTVTLSADPIRSDVTYSWTTTDGQISGDANSATIQVTQPGTYILHSSLQLGSLDCPIPDVPQTIYNDPTKPFFNGPPVYNYTVPCNSNDGSVTVSASGATKPYTFYLYKDNVLQNTFTADISASSHTFTGLTAGNYRVDVKGVVACIETTGPFTIPPKIPVVINPTLTNVTCSGYKNGAISLSVTGGNPPLSYLWNTGNTSQNLLNTGAATYTITITDADGCITTGTYTVTQPSPLVGTIVKTDDTNSDPVLGTGTADLTVTGGTPSYTYNWTASQTGTVPAGQQNNQDPNSLDYGSYTVVATDANGCTTTATIFIYEPEVCNDGIDNDGNGLTDCADPHCIPAAPGPITPTSSSPCISVNVTYNVVAVSGLTYDWTWPANTTDISGQGTNSLTLKWTNTTPGQVCVRANNGSCVSSQSCLSVIPKESPLAPGNIIKN